MEIISKQHYGDELHEEFNDKGHRFWTIKRNSEQVAAMIGKELDLDGVQTFEIKSIATKTKNHSIFLIQKALNSRRILSFQNHNAKLHGELIIYLMKDEDIKFTSILMPTTGYKKAIHTKTTLDDLENTVDLRYIVIERIANF